jgi:DNA-directed RNA polymerase specialized sigma24 family protein
MEDRPSRPDDELLRAVAEGDTGALRVLYDRHSPWLTVRLVRRCNDRGVVAEVVQDTFVAV